MGSYIGSYPILTNEPLVSFLINNYNYGKYLNQAIESTLSQTYSNVETIVVDDGSTDNSREIIKQYGSRITSIFKKHVGQAAAMNAGFEASRGDIICFLDADDLCLPKRAAEVVKCFSSFQETNWFFHESVPMKLGEGVDVSEKFASGEIIGRDIKSEIKEIDFREELRIAKLPNFTPSTSNLCFSRRFLEHIFPLPKTSGFSGLAICDFYLKLLAVGLGKGYRTHKDLGVFRLHANNLYSGREVNSKRKVYAEIHIATAYHMKTRWPEFSRLSDKLLSKGLGTYWKSNEDNTFCNQLIREYFKDISSQKKVEIYLRSFYYFSKLNFGNKIV